MEIFTNIDPETAALIEQPQILDSQELSLILERRGKGKEEDVPDTPLALQMYREELQQTACIIQDRRMPQSIASTCQTDGNILASSLSEEQISSNDHQVACKLGGVQAPDLVDPWIIASGEMDEELLAKLSARFISLPREDEMEISGECEYDYGNAESSAWGVIRTDSRSLYRRCVVCREYVRFFETARVPCGHEYCRDCLQRLFRASMIDDTLFPPRCCRQPVTPGGVRIFLTADLIKQHEQKKNESNTPDRTYCSNPFCSSFLRLQNVHQERATCLDCGTETCTMCKAPGHAGDCPADTGLQQVLDVSS
jgi:hypothetical protein